MGITGTFFGPSENINDLVNNKIDTAYYILDDISFNYSPDVLENTELTKVKLVLTIYTNYNDRINRSNVLGDLFFFDYIEKDTNFGNLWETYYTKCKQHLTEHFKAELQLKLYSDNIIAGTHSVIPDEYKNLISFTDS